MATKTYDGVVAGSVLVKSGILLPDSTRLESSSIGGWSVLHGTDSAEIEAQIRQYGWHFFYIVPAFVERSIALSRRTAIAQAIGKATKKMDEQGLNAVEIISLNVRRVLGVYIVRLVIQPRHIRRDPYFADLKPHTWANWKPEPHNIASESLLDRLSEAA